LPKSLYIEPTPDDPNIAAIKWGPIVLAGDMGTETGGNRRGRGSRGRGRAERPANVPVLVAAGQPVTEWLKPIEDQPGNFRTEKVGFLADGTAKDVDFMPFYLLQEHAYTIYWNFYTKQEWETRN
jgi:hypothetical protein